MVNQSIFKEERLFSLIFERLNGALHRRDSLPHVDALHRAKVTALTRYLIYNF